MSYVFSGKIQSAMFVNPPQNTTIELLYGEGSELTAFHLNVDYSRDEFLAFIDEWPLEKIEKDARENARRLAVEIQKQQNVIATIAAHIDSKKIIDYINKNNNSNTDIFDMKLIILENIVSLKDKSLKLRIRKAKTVLDLLQIYNEII
jgi:hypothetical protein